MSSTDAVLPFSSLELPPSPLPSSHRRPRRPPRAIVTGPDAAAGLLHPKPPPSILTQRPRPDLRSSLLLLLLSLPESLSPARASGRLQPIGSALLLNLKPPSASSLSLSWSPTLASSPCAAPPPPTPASSPCATPPPRLLRRHRWWRPKP